MLGIFHRKVSKDLRVRIPRAMAEAAGIKPGSRVVILGAGTHAELWDAERFNEIEKPEEERIRTLKEIIEKIDL